MLAYAAGAEQQQRLSLQALVGMALPDALLLLLAIEWQLAGQAEQMAEHILAHQGAEDAADIGEQVVAAATGVQQHIDPGISRLEPA